MGFVRANHQRFLRERMMDWKVFIAQIRAALKAGVFHTPIHIKSVKQGGK